MRTNRHWLGRVTLSLVLILLVTTRSTSSAQFSLPLPRTVGADTVFREDMLVLFKDFIFDKRATVARKEITDGKKMGKPAAEARRFAWLADSARDSLPAYRAMVEEFCKQQLGVAATKCSAVLEPSMLLETFDTDTHQILLGRTWIGAPFVTKRPYFSRYLRNSNTSDGLSIASHFAATVGETDAYVVTSLVRGVIGRGIFSADQALVVTRSDSANPAKRDTIESDRSTLLRAINNGGTLVGRYTIPFFARGGATMSRVIGLNLSVGVLGPVTGESKRRTGVASSSLEAVAAFPVRDLGGTSALVADLTVGMRAGYTYAGLPLREAGGYRDVGFIQGIVGLRQNGALSISALVTVANHGMNELVPRLSLNFAAVR